MLQLLKNRIARTYAPIVGLVVLGIVTFFNALSNGFVWLDNKYVLSPKIAHLTIEQIFHGSTLTAADFYRPINAIYYTLAQQIFGQTPLYYHIFQISIHIINAIIVYFIFTRFYKKPISLVLASVFLVHPLMESSAVYISNSADVLYMFFGLIAILLTVRVGFNVWILLLKDALILLSLLSKESGVLFLIFLITYQITHKTRKAVLYTINSVIVVGIYIGIRYANHGFNTYDIDLYPFQNAGLAQRLINVPSILAFYIKNLFYPLRIGMNHLWFIEAPNFTNFGIPLVICIVFFGVIIGCGVWLHRNHRRAFKQYVVYFIPFIVSMGALMQIIPLDYTVASRWFCFPMFALLGIVGIPLNMIHMSRNSMRDFALVSILIIGFLSYRTILRNRYWQNNITLFTRSAVIDDNYVTESWLAMAYLDQGDYTQALKHIDKSTAMFPFDNNLAIKGFILEKMGKATEARAAYRLARSADNYAPLKHDEYTYQLLAQYYLRNDRMNRADEILTQAVSDFPNNDYFWTLMALVDEHKGEHDNALYDIMRAQELNPTEPVIMHIYNSLIQNQKLDFDID